jgi:hypothetical protein
MSKKANRLLCLLFLVYLILPFSFTFSDENGDTLLPIYVGEVDGSKIESLGVTSQDINFYVGVSCSSAYNPSTNDQLPKNCTLNASTLTKNCQLGILGPFKVTPGRVESFSSASTSPAKLMITKDQFKTYCESSGQPPTIRFYGGPYTTYKKGSFSGGLQVKVFKDFMLPNVGFGATGNVGIYKGSFEKMAGIYVEVPLISFKEIYNFKENELSSIFSLDVSPKRGWPFTLGFDWSTKNGQVGLHATAQLSKKKYRQNREKKMHATLPLSDPKGVVPDRSAFEESSSLKTLLENMGWIDELTTPDIHDKDFFEPSENKQGKYSAQGIKTYLDGSKTDLNKIDSDYHEVMKNIFSEIVGESSTVGDDSAAVAGDKLATIAEWAILEQILVPFNRLFGQVKKPFSLDGYKQNALSSFVNYVGQDPRIAGKDKKDLCKKVFVRITDKISEIAIRAKERWGDTRLVWLPLNYGLRLDQYDSQIKVNGLLAHIIGRSKSRANKIEYLFSNQFHYKLKNMILETEDYHVLIIHDFRDDKLGWDMVANGYMAALTKAIDEIAGGKREKLPQFMIFLDENYYKANKSQRIISYLENLYDPGKYEPKDPEIRRMVKEAHTKLIDAIGRAGADRFGGAFLKENIRINVSITFTYDPAFPADLPFRDHRKLSFRDVFEEDASKGEGILTGEGIGEHYNGQTWEDRSLLIQGDELVFMKSLARRLFLSQGYKPKELPDYLKQRDETTGSMTIRNNLIENGWNAEIVAATNLIGGSEKMATVLKASLYNLAQKGSVIVAPDSLWASDFWAGMFLGASLRGVRVFAISPSFGNAPSAAPFTMEGVRENLSRMALSSKFFADEIKRSGGFLHVGVYKMDEGVSNLGKRLALFMNGYKSNSFLKDLFRLSPSVMTTLETLSTEMAGVEIPFLIFSKKTGGPRLHLKAQFFVSKSGINLFALDEWSPVIHKMIMNRVGQIQDPQNHENAVSSEFIKTDQDALRLTEAFNALSTNLPEAERGKEIYFLTVGSHNQDRRSMMIDAEVLAAVGGHQSLIAAMDFLFLLGTATWIDAPEEVDKYFPKASSLIKKISKIIRDHI